MKIKFVRVGFQLIIIFIVLCFTFDQLIKYRLINPILVFDSQIPELLFSAEGVCLFPFIFFKHDSDYYIRWNMLKKIIIHEMTHFEQVLENGFFGFYLKYLFYWGYYSYKVGYRESYYLIPYEVEAFELEKRSEPTLYQKGIIDKIYITYYEKNVKYFISTEHALYPDGMVSDTYLTLTIVFGIVFGILNCLLLAIIFWWIMRRRRTTKEEEFTELKEF